MCDNTHGAEDDEQIHEDGRGSQPSESLQCSDLPDDATSNGADHNADNEAEFPLGHLRDGLAGRDDDQRHVQEELK